MPLFQAAGKLHLYTHVPKCGGQSVEDYLVDRFGPLAFIDNQFYKTPAADRWTKSSPQHADATAIAKLFPEDWIASRFAVIRHPVARFASSYNYYLANLKRTPHLVGAEEWFNEYLGFVEKNPHYLDNHLRPQTEMVADDSAVFRLEDGMDPVVAYLDGIVGNSDGPRQIGHGHVTQKVDGMEKAPLSSSLLLLLRKHYAADFDRFGYNPDAVVSASVYVAQQGEWTKTERMRHHIRRLRRRLWRRSQRLRGRVSE